MLDKKITSLRKQNHWTQEELSEKLGIKQPQLNRWETGKSYPTIEGLKKISKIFNISIDALVFDDRDIKNLSSKDKTFISQLKDFEKLNELEKQNILNLIQNLAKK